MELHFNGNFIVSWRASPKADPGPARHQNKFQTQKFYRAGTAPPRLEIPGSATDRCP